MKIDSQYMDSAAIRWRTYGRWAALNLVAFGILYPLVNWLTEMRRPTFGFYLPSEIAIPFIPEWIWVYFSINLLFFLPPFFLRTAEMQLLGKRMFAATVCGVAIFLLLPAHLGFARVVPEAPIYRTAFSALFQADGQHNLFPSLHVTYASLCVYGFQSAVRGLLSRVLLWIWLILIMASTVLVHQHHLLDIVSGMMLAVVVCIWVSRDRSGPAWLNI